MTSFRDLRMQIQAHTYTYAYNVSGTAHPPMRGPPNMAVSGLYPGYIKANPKETTLTIQLTGHIRTDKYHK